MENGPDAGPCTRPRYVRSPTRSARALVVNDLHSQLNLTEVSGVVRVSSLESLQLSVSDAARQGRAVSVAGGRHAMGGQQFASGDMVLDTTPDGPDPGARQRPRSGDGAGGRPVARSHRATGG